MPDDEEAHKAASFIQARESHSDVPFTHLPCATERSWCPAVCPFRGTHTLRPDGHTCFLQRRMKSKYAARAAAAAEGAKPLPAAPAPPAMPPVAQPVPAPAAPMVARPPSTPPPHQHQQQRDHHQQQQGEEEGPDYLQRAVVPLLRQALRDLASEQSDDPLLFLAEYMRSHRPPAAATARHG